MSSGLPEFELWSSRLHRSIARAIVRSIDRLLSRSLDRSIDRSLTRSLDCSIARLIARSLACSIACSFDRSIDRSLARLLDRSLARSNARSFSRSLAHSLAHSIDWSLDRSLARSKKIFLMIMRSSMTKNHMLSPPNPNAKGLDCNRICPMNTSQQTLHTKVWQPHIHIASIWCETSWHNRSSHPAHSKTKKSARTDLFIHSRPTILHARLFNRAVRLWILIIHNQDKRKVVKYLQSRR